jgi:hypothetical protein
MCIWCIKIGIVFVFQTDRQTAGRTDWGQNLYAPDHSIREHKNNENRSRSSYIDEDLETWGTLNTVHNRGIYMYDQVSSQVRNAAGQTLMP